MIIKLICNFLSYPSLFLNNWVSQKPKFHSCHLFIVKVSPKLTIIYFCTSICLNIFHILARTTINRCDNFSIKYRSYILLFSHVNYVKLTILSHLLCLFWIMPVLWLFCFHGLLAKVSKFWVNLTCIKTSIYLTVLFSL